IIWPVKRLQAFKFQLRPGGNPREATLEDIVELYHTAW
ncbi:hypothetical protein ACUOA9_36675, partial [Escherichia sp. HC-TM1]